MQCSCPMSQFERMIKKTSLPHRIETKHRDMIRFREAFKKTFDICQTPLEPLPPSVNIIVFTFLGTNKNNF